MGGDVAQRTPKRSLRGGRRPKRRIAVRLDMTPMVDIAFLLLIFYMVSTVFAMPQAMEINLPPDGPPVILAESNLLTVRVDKEGRYLWNLATASSSNRAQLLPSALNSTDGDDYVVSVDTLRGLLLERNRENARLNTLVVIHPDAYYEDWVTILDEIDILERAWNAYTAQQMGIDQDDLPDSLHFSYRYALREWEICDTRAVAGALESHRE